jgi:hypothetical protein
MGAVVQAWWQYHVPDWGQLSNVSGFVVPERMPVAEHEDMGSRDELVQRLLDSNDRLLDILKMTLGSDAHTGRELRRLQDDPVALREAYDQAIGTYQPPKPKRPGHRPNEKEMREYTAFRLRYQVLERDIRRDLHLADDDEVTREMMYAHGGEHPRAMLNHMLWHGLGRQWGPSTWPDQAPGMAW